MKIKRMRKRWKYQNVENRYRFIVIFEFEINQWIMYKAEIYNKSVHKSKMFKDYNFGAVYSCEIFSNVRRIYCSHYCEWKINLHIINMMMMMKFMWFIINSRWQMKQEWKVTETLNARLTIKYLINLLFT